MEVTGPWSKLGAIYREATEALRSVPGTLAASAHQSHAYPDGACLYFTFAGKPDPADKDRYYRAAWDAGTRAVLARGGALSHHHGVGINRARFMAEALGTGTRGAGCAQAGARPQGHPQPGQARPRQPVRSEPVRRAGVALRSRHHPVSDADDAGEDEPATREPLDLVAIGRGAALAVVVVLPAAIVQTFTDKTSSVQGLMLAAILLGLGWGGAVAGKAQPERALTHGGLASLTAFVVIQGLGVVLRLARGELIHPVSIVFGALLATSCGVRGRPAGHPQAPQADRERRCRRRHRRLSGTGRGYCQGRRHTYQGEPSVSILVVDVGTSGVRAAIVAPDATIAVEHHRQVLPDSPDAGLVEFDAAHLAEVTLDLARRALAEGGPVDGVGITNQRASAIVWDRATGQPVGPALGWQDLRTVGECLVLQADGLRLAPNQSATKLAWLLDTYDPDRSRDLCFGTPDTLGGLAALGRRAARHRPVQRRGDRAGRPRGHPLGRGGARQAAHPGLDAADHRRLDRRARPGDGPCPASRSSPASLGDQQASLLGQGVRGTRPGQDHLRHRRHARRGGRPADPRFETRGGGGTFPIVAWRREGTTTWGLEAIMLSAGTNVEWLRDDLGLIETAEQSHDVAAECETTDGVVYVPALLGLGTPRWDYGARGTLLGLTRGAGRPQVVRAVLEGVAQRGADLVEAAEADGAPVAALRIDGGMSRNPTFVQALADATQRQVEVSPAVEATTLGAAFAAGLGLGTWGTMDDIAATWAPTTVVDPGEPLDRQRWAGAVERAAGWFPELSGLDF